YTRQIGILDEQILRSPYSLAEVRVLYEIAGGKGVSAVELADALRLDRGYLSRILRRLQKGALVRRETSAADRRRSVLTLKKKGRRPFDTLDARQEADVAALLARVPAAAGRRLTDSMCIIEDILGGPREHVSEPYILRQHRPGDMGWITHRHGVLY